MHSRKKVGAASIWKYDELPPADLLRSLHAGQAPISHSEFFRAEWFWNRRPKVLSESLLFFFCYLTVFVCLLYYIPETIPLLVIWIVAGVSCLFVDRIRLNRWRNEYESLEKCIISQDRSATLPAKERWNMLHCRSGLRMSPSVTTVREGRCRSLVNGPNFLILSSAVQTSR